MHIKKIRGAITFVTVNWCLRQLAVNTMFCWGAQRVIIYLEDITGRTRD